MDGPTHYREAENMIASVMGPNPDVATAEDARDIVALAQVHATLALAAATAMSGRTAAGGSPNADIGQVSKHAGMWPSDFRAWDQAAGVGDA